MAGSGEDLAIRRRRVRYRAWHRGTRELDILLGRYADAHIEAMDAAALDALERLMNASEPQLMAWLTRDEGAPADQPQWLVDAIRAFHQAHPTVQA